MHIVVAPSDEDQGCADPECALGGGCLGSGSRTFRRGGGVPTAGELAAS
jgi:hypothetical protein